ncbi:glycosyltransferase family 2 protein [Siminovitchia acidinfaciens]|uniref:Glycosyltransferase family 2 protein n=1 Tax=Siminovitchia acidinfaciens TaxID=2321395 RepID=A0A429Y4Q3_9BACI|nr:glycosyltransferase family A protein [Siminovitchia acidinfaciens]RST76319.1 glycosyltransferase family 2 protein [Siminovitchia acidinfaciens]
MSGISIVTSTIKPQFMDNIFENFDRQNWEDKELIIILNKDDMKIERWKMKAGEYKNVSIYQLPEEVTLGECLNYGTEKAKHGYVAKFDDDDYYGPEYISQAMEAFENTDAVLVGKRTTYTYFKKEKILTMDSGRFFRKSIYQKGDERRDDRF